MSVALDGPVDRFDPVPPREQEPAGRRTVVAAVIATLAVILGPLAGLWTLGRALPGDVRLTPVARQVLDVAPGAYTSGDLVVVPADPTSWSNAVPSERIDGQVVTLGVRGLTRPGYLPFDRTLPELLPAVADSDRVYIDVGELVFACTRWPGATDCTGSLLMNQWGERYILRSGLGPGSLGAVRRFPALEDGLPTSLALGLLPPGAVTGDATFAGRPGVTARVNTSEPGAVGGETLWWVTTPEEVGEITFLDGDGREVGSAG